MSFLDEAGVLPTPQTSQTQFPTGLVVVGAAALAGLMALSLWPSPTQNAAQLATWKAGEAQRARVRRQLEQYSSILDKAYRWEKDY